MEKKSSQGSSFSNFSQSSTKSETSIFFSPSQEKKDIDAICEIIDLPVMDTVKSKSSSTNLTLQIVTSIIKKIENVSNCRILENLGADFLQDAGDFLEIMRNLQNRFEKTDNNGKKLEILALLPKKWSFREISKNFECSHYLYRKLNQFDRNLGKLMILQSISCLIIKWLSFYLIENICSHKRKQYLRIPEDTRKAISDYYRDETNCYTCPGQKECISTVDEDGNKVHKQKLLLSYTVNELYNNFLADFKDKLEILPKFSYFASLKPKECIVAGDPGSHSICICDEHENVRLRLLALNKAIKYKEILSQSFCDLENRNCMLHACKSCPGLPKIEEIINDYLKDDNKKITYNFWEEEGSRARLETYTTDAKIFKENLCHDIFQLSIHHFISAEQKNYLNFCKKFIGEETCIIIMDFSENYSFQIQRSVQAFYYNNSQATVHPFIIYYKKPKKTQGGEEEVENDSELEHVCFCVISDTKDHVAYSIHAFTEALMSVIKREFPWIKKIIYFSDGAPQQYKNK